jgi:hypothetical protein
MRRLAPLAAVAGLAALAALAGPAAADVRFEGRTSQGRLAILVAEDDGVPKRVKINWHARCRVSGVTLPQSTVFRRPLDLSTGLRIRDAGSYRSRRYRDGVRLTIRVRVIGRKVSPRRWRGRFSARALVRQRGRVIDRCAVRGLRWRVRR